MNTSDYIAAGSFIAAAMAVIYAYFSNTKKYELISQYRNEVINWYDETTDILIRLQHEASANFPDLVLRRELLSRLSSRIETGRFYFPNIDKGDFFGSKKPLPYQGYRNLVLDFLVISYDLFSKDEAPELLHHANELQRYYTAFVFKVLDPVEFVKDTQKYTDKTFSNDLRSEDFFKQAPDSIKNYF